MSSVTGEMARAVICADELSTKNATLDSSPTASAMPATEASVRRGLRTRSLTT